MLRLKKINKKIGVFSLIDIDFTVDKGDYFMLIGQSGAGKSMLLELITGIMMPDSGDILLNGKSMLQIPTQKRKLGIVYQKPTLFPHLSVFENIAYPLKIKKLRKEEIKRQVQKLAEDTEIRHLLKRNIHSLSGGEVQRVTIARTLATNPEVLLLDEPLSFLDIQLKRGMLALLRKLNQHGQTIIHVTHDYDEALSLTNNIALIENGTLIQSGTPKEVFQQPKSAFVANFTGINNFFKGRLVETEDYSGLKIFKTDETKILTNTDQEINSEGYLLIPDDAITISDEKLLSSAVNNFNGIITDLYQTSNGTEVIINIGIELSVKISGYSFEKLKLAIGKMVWISFKASTIRFVIN